jgi:trehalose/maltose hydrolase-like predicted phosphorylase
MRTVTLRAKGGSCAVVPLAAGVVVAFLLTGGPGIAVQPASASTGGSSGSDPAGGTGSYLLTATNSGTDYAPTFTGNGELGIRVPPAGQGYSGGSVPTQSELAGFYAEPVDGVQQRANIPTWSTLTYSDGGQPFTMANGRTSDWRQSIDLRTGVITTNALWTASDGHVTELNYQVLTDRARPHVGLVRLELTPRWSGVATVTDTIDGSPADLSTQSGKGWSPSTDSDWETVQSVGTGINATIASQVGTSHNIKATTTRVDQTVDQSVGQQLAFPVTAGQRYTVTKYVGVESSQDTSTATVGAEGQARDAAASGFGSLMMANDAAWATLWEGRIDVLGDPALASDVNASEFYLWSSTRAGVDWSISPAGLSSNGYNGHIFWDADTWMYPALLAQHPDLAAEMDTYRFQRLAAAEQHAAATGYKGARYPWESALTGTEQIPPPSSVFTEGLYEQHVTADVALAQWQYYLATGDKTWLAQRGWPVLSQAAAFWASRVSLGANGSYHINGVTGPDEESPDVDDEVYTNVAAKTVLEDATQAARVLGVGAPADWTSIASGIVVPEGAELGIIPEYAGYNSGLVKQADVTMLEYPLDYHMPASVAESDINYYVPRTDPNGPSMSDAVNSIDTSALGTPGCASFVYTQRSEQPFIRDVFDQFSETSTGGAFTFMTGIGGFLQEFIYGYSGLRFGAKSVELAPSLTGQLDGVVLHGLAWHGRRFTLAIGQKTTSMTLTGGDTMPITTQTGPREIEIGQTLTVPTRRPDLASTSDEVRCGSATATSSQPGAPALAAVDGSPATYWQPRSLPATLTAPVSDGARSVGAVTLQWGQQWPGPSSSTQPPAAGPVITLRATSYVVAASLDGHTWHTVAQVDGRTAGTTDVLRFAPVRARYISVRITASTDTGAPKLDELTVSRQA